MFRRSRHLLPIVSILAVTVAGGPVTAGPPVNDVTPTVQSLRSAVLERELAAPPPAPRGPGTCLTTPMVGGNGQAGVMWDATATMGDLFITSFKGNFDGGFVGDVKVYYVTALTSFVGQHANPGAWTLLGVANVTSLGTNLATPVPIGGVVIPAGVAVGFYMTVEPSIALNYTNSAAVDVSDAFLTIHRDRGLGVAALFGGTFTVCLFNGTMCYVAAGTVGACCTGSACADSVDAIACVTGGGAFLGAGTTCTPADICDRGACCDTFNGNCTPDLTATECAALGANASFLGVLTDCADCAAACCPVIVNSFPYTEDFEAGQGDWVNRPDDDFDWLRNSGGTPSGGTGPSVDHTTGTAAGFYTYGETSSQTVGAVAILEGPCVDTSALATPVLTFWYHMYGATMGTLEVEVSADGCQTWTNVGFSVSGDQGDVWHAAIVDLGAFANQTIRLRFKGTRGTSFTGDFAVDDVGFGESPPLGACCNDDGTGCGANVLEVDCAVGSRWEANVGCGGMSPPCGDVVGGCCIAGACTADTGNTCFAAGGSWFAGVCGDRPCNNYCDQPFVVLDGVPEPVDNTNAIGQALSLGSPGCTDPANTGTAPLWYIYTAPQDGDVTFDLCEYTGDGTIQVFSDPIFPNVAPACADIGVTAIEDCDDDGCCAPAAGCGGTLSRFMFANEQVRIAVGSWDNNTGTGFLKAESIAPGLGACCRLNGTCSITNSPNCDSATAFHAATLPCFAATACGPLGGCCLGMNGCEVTFSQTCGWVFGQFLGEGSDCGPGGPGVGVFCSGGINPSNDFCMIATGQAEDCDGNGTPDNCDIFDCPPGDPSCSDCNSDGILDQCQIRCCLGDGNGDGVRDGRDVADLIATYLAPLPACYDAALCVADGNGDGTLDIATDIPGVVDALLLNTGICPP